VQLDAAASLVSPRRGFSSSNSKPASVSERGSGGRAVPSFLVRIVRGPKSEGISRGHLPGQPCLRHERLQPAGQISYYGGEAISDFLGISVRCVSNMEDRMCAYGSGRIVSPRQFYGTTYSCVSFHEIQNVKYQLLWNDKM
jgi:hypothetical protein